MPSKDFDDLVKEKLAEALENIRDTNYDPGEGDEGSFLLDEPDDLSGISILGKKVDHPISADQLETFPRPESVVAVDFQTDEVTSLCPKTGQPDFHDVRIKYIPDKVCLESKALKLYLWGFRTKGMFIEQMAHRIAEDLFGVLKPLRIDVQLEMKPRGGITIQATSTFPIYNPHIPEE